LPVFIKKNDEEKKDLKADDFSLNKKTKTTLSSETQIEKQNREEERQKPRVSFVLKRKWFFYSQTEGREINFEEISKEHKKDYGFDVERVLKAFDITKESFDYLDGNTQGYAELSNKNISLNPLAENPFKTTIHEVAHVLLHSGDDWNLKTEIKEIEAEGAVYLVLSLLGIEKGKKESRGYVQSYLNKSSIKDKERVSKRIIKTACEILEVGKS